MFGFVKLKPDNFLVSYPTGTYNCLSPLLRGDYRHVFPPLVFCQSLNPRSLRKHAGKPGDRLTTADYD